MKNTFAFCLVICFILTALGAPSSVLAHPAHNPAPPPQPVKLIFVHHSTGGNWLADSNSDQPYGGLGRALMDNNYFVSATNYGWGPDSIGDRTDIPNWPEWFTGPDSATYLAALYAESGQNVGDFGNWSRLNADPGGENEIIMFKSCFPNSDLYGNPGDPPLSEPNDQYTVENAKAVYNNILTYFVTRPDKLFVVITAPPLMREETEAGRADNARAFNNWLVNDWLQNYPYANVAVFDYYNVLTGDGNHHHWHNGAMQHVQVEQSNFAAYPSGDSHPSSRGHQKATAEFVPLLNVFYNRWKGSAGGASLPMPTAPSALPTATPALDEPTQPAQPTPETYTSPAGNVIDDFETDAGYHTDSDNATITLDFDGSTAHSGQSSLRIEYDISPGGGGSLGRSFEQLQDWSNRVGFSFWIKTEKAGLPLTLMSFSGDLDSPTPFETVIEIPPEAASGWTQLTFGWETFSKAGWAGEEGIAALNLTRITGYGISLNESDQNQGTLWLDNIRLITDEAQAVPVPGAAPTTAPVEAPQQTDAPPPAETPPSGGACPAGVLILTLGLFVALRTNLR